MGLDDSRGSCSSVEDLTRMSLRKCAVDPRPFQIWWFTCTVSYALNVSYADTTHSCLSLTYKCTLFSGADTEKNASSSGFLEYMIAYGSEASADGGRGHIRLNSWSASLSRAREQEEV